MDEQNKVRKPFSNDNAKPREQRDNGMSIFERSLLITFEAPGLAISNNRVVGLLLARDMSDG